MDHIVSLISSSWKSCGRVVCNTGMEPAESELMTHESVVLGLLANETVPPQFKGPQEVEG